MLVVSAIVMWNVQPYVMSVKALNDRADGGAPSES